MFIHDSMLLHLVPAVTLTAGLRLPFCQTLYLSDCCIATRSVPCSSNLPFCPGNPSEDRKKTKLILRLLQNVMKFLILPHVYTSSVNQLQHRCSCNAVCDVKGTRWIFRRCTYKTRVFSSNNSIVSYY